jgi:hypothetical protein
MSGKLFQDTDGACAASQAVLAYLRKRSIEPSWNAERREYDAEPRVSRWENGREQGYVVWLRVPSYTGPQLNIAFFEHRNSNEICAVEFEASTWNSPRLDDIPESHPYHNSKWAASHTVRYNQAYEMADWITERLTAHWVKHSQPAKAA